MSEIQVVDLPRKDRRTSKFQPFIDAALVMPAGKAVLVDVEGVKAHYGNLNTAILVRGLKEKLAVRMTSGKVYLIHRADK